MCENAVFQCAAGILMTVFVPCLAALEVLRWSLTSLVSQQKGFWRRVGWDGGVLSLFHRRTETPCVSAASGQNQTRPYREKTGPGREREQGLRFLTNGRRLATATVGKAKFNRKFNYKKQK